MNILSLDAGARLNDFIEVPWNLYQNDPHWVPPLKWERRDALSPKAPFFQHVDWQGWVAYEKDRPVARISAQIDNLYEHLHGEKVGYFGLIEAPDDQACFDALLGLAKDWLAARGRERMVGPFNLGQNQEVGLLVDGFDTPAFFMMPHSLPYYAKRIEQAGLDGLQDMLAYLMDPDYEIPRVMQMLQKRYLGGVKVRSVNTKDLDTDLEIMRDIFNDAWSQNWGFVPFTEQEFRAVGKEMLLITPREFLKIAELDGRPVAFIVLLPNLNEAIKDLNGSLLPFGWLKLLWRLKVKFPTTGRVPLMGVRKEFHHTKLGPGLAFAVIEAMRQPALDRGINPVELSWILEDNKGMCNIIESIGGYASKRYRVYTAKIDAPAIKAAPSH